VQLSQETSRAADYLRNIFESGKTLKLSDPQRLSNGNSYAFIVTAYGKESDFCLTREQLDDVPGTREYRDAANDLARNFEFRFKNCNPNLFVSTSGRVLHISPEWPAMPLLNSAGTGYIAASGTRVVVKDHLSQEIAICLVKVTHMQTFPGPHSTPFHRLAAIVNSIRSDVDAGRVVFHPSFEQHPRIMQNVDFRYDAKAPDGTPVSQYLEQKVWLLGFRCGRKDSQVWIADPWDATYLGCGTTSLHQEASILEAKDLIRLNDSADFARAGKSLLSQGGPQTRSIASSVLVATSCPTDPEFDVFISHSTIDKPYVEPLVKALEAAGISVWFDKTSMEWGDSLRSEIDRGLAACRYGIVLFSKAFLNKKKWTEHELNALFAKEEPGKKVILPIWHGITREDLIQYSPAFADRLAKNSVTDSYADIVASLQTMLGRPASLPPLAAVPAVSESLKEKASAIVRARYDAKGKNTPWVHAHIRPVLDAPNRFTFENSEGTFKTGDADEVALEFIRFDRSLMSRGYTRMEFGNLSGDRRFDLFG
jgi:hypothetical protein